MKTSVNTCDCCGRQHIPVETNNYRAKATFPVGNPWASGWTNKPDAIRQAEKFCDDWRDIGVIAEATVFYRDGSAVEHFKSRETVTILKNL